MSTEPRDAAYWAKDVTTLKLGDMPAEAINLNVTGRRVVGPVQGFGKMWQKTMRVELTGADIAPAEVIKTWKAEFQRFWPERNWFYAPLEGIAPGEVALLNLGLPGRMKLFTVVQIQALERTNDPLYELGYLFGGNRLNSRFWVQTAENLARHFGVEPKVESQVVCVDRRRQWHKAGNLSKNAAIRTFVWTLGTPVRWVRRLLTGRRAGTS
jgi:hypothetical protein